jgi:ATP10 protein
MRLSGIVFSAAVAASLCAVRLLAQAASMPTTVGETLSGKRIVLADAVRGHVAVLVAGFSHDGGMACGDWMKAIRTDPALSGVDVHQIAMLEGAPGLIRGLIKSGMRKGMSSEDQQRSVVLTQDDKLWQKYFAVSNAQVAQVMLLDAQGNVVWRGHGAASAGEPQLRNAASSH